MSKNKRRLIETGRDPINLLSNSSEISSKPFSNTRADSSTHDRKIGATTPRQQHRSHRKGKDDDDDADLIDTTLSPIEYDSLINLTRSPVAKTVAQTHKSALLLRKITNSSLLSLTTNNNNHDIIDDKPDKAPEGHLDLDDTIEGEDILDKSPVRFVNYHTSSQKSPRSIRTTTVVPLQNEDPARAPLRKGTPMRFSAATSLPAPSASKRPFALYNPKEPVPRVGSTRVDDSDSEFESDFNEQQDQLTHEPAVASAKLSTTPSFQRTTKPVVASAATSAAASAAAAANSAKTPATTNANTSTNNTNTSKLLTPPEKLYSPRGVFTTSTVISKKPPTTSLLLSKPASRLSPPRRHTTTTIPGRATRIVPSSKRPIVGISPPRISKFSPVDPQERHKRRKMMITTPKSEPGPSLNSTKDIAETLTKATIYLDMQRQKLKDSTGSSNRLDFDELEKDTTGKILNFEEEEMIQLVVDDDDDHGEEAGPGEGIEIDAPLDSSSDERKLKSGNESFEASDNFEGTRVRGRIGGMSKNDRVRKSNRLGQSNSKNSSRNSSHDSDMVSDNENKVDKDIFNSQLRLQRIEDEDYHLLSNWSTLKWNSLIRFLKVYQVTQNDEMLNEKSVRQRFSCDLRELKLRMMILNKLNEFKLRSARLKTVAGSGYRDN